MPRPAIAASTLLAVLISAAGMAADRRWLSGLDVSDPSALCTAKSRFLSRFGPGSPEQAAAFFDLKESPNGLGYDGAVSIPWDRLRSRLRRWEKFRDENRHVAPLVAHIDRQLKWIFEIYLCGMDNSRPFDNRGQMQELVRDSYQQFLRLNTDSRQYSLLVNAVAILRNHAWRLSPELIRLYDSHGYSTAGLKQMLAH